ncbi:hypothetical protein [Microvirga guangxiensis]|uniref:Transposase n=1 Tax=Microvirga guangxiensis TaxID=549386 RepID=A0A1G5LKU8_9HYPH|nr:hypothetical protein [Microvirga guangxiensis]SCZ13492.1 hypothetical protein SAMN02927923_04452 [Microvirga guangxiensis]
MPKKRLSLQQIIAKLYHIEEQLTQGNSIAPTCTEVCRLSTASA